MKKRFGKLPKMEQEKIEMAYHQMRPEEFAEQMVRAQQHTPEVLRLPPKLIERLKITAQSAGEVEYQTMVQRWIEERLRQEIAAAG